MLNRLTCGLSIPFHSHTCLLQTPGETGDSQIAESNVTSKPLHKGATLDQRAAIKNANRDKHREEDDSKTSTPPPISAATTEITETPSNSPGTGGTGSSPHSHGQVPISTADPSTDATRTNPPSSSAYAIGPVSQIMHTLQRRYHHCDLCGFFLKHAWLPSEREYTFGC